MSMWPKLSFVIIYVVVMIITYYIHNDTFYSENKLSIFNRIDVSGYSLDHHFEESVPLYKTEAEKRALIFSDVSYKFILALQKDEKFNGFAKVKFRLNDVDFNTTDYLFIDYHGLGIKNYKINGIEADAGLLFDRSRIKLDSDLLKTDDVNTVELYFMSKYQNDGTGAHYFTDSEDNSTYIYTQFEPMQGYKALPLFDQPDLKAEMELSIMAPQDWTVISNGAVKSNQTYNSTKTPDGLLEPIHSYSHPYTYTTFATTPRIPSYLYAFIAGPFDYIEKIATIPDGSDSGTKEMPMRVYFRKSLRQDVNRVAPFMFNSITEGIQFYTDYFDTPFQFDKYDQIFCPEYKYSGMENVAAVTLTERLLFRGSEITEQDTTTLIMVLSHELLHHWFGNYVTMKWWDDLWLNEAFTTYVAFYQMSSVPSIFEITPSTWLVMNRYKTWGYEEDEISTTHPILTKAAHTNAVLDMIDGITYGKGLSFIKQLHKLMGEKSFKHALQSYFKKYAWGNTRLDDFLHTLNVTYASEHSGHGIDIEQWSKQFLTTKGVNIITTERQNNTLVVTQELGEQSDSLILQEFEIFAFDESLNSEILTVYTSDKERVTKFKFENLGSKSMFIINHGDYAYSQMYLDSQTSLFLSKNLDKIDDLITRVLVWRSLLGMVKHRKIKTEIYFEFITHNLKKETSPSLVKAILDSTFLIISDYIPDSRYHKRNSEMFEFLYEWLLTESDPNMITILNESIMLFLVEPDHVKIATEWLKRGYILDKNGDVLSNSELNLQMKQTLIKSVFRLDDKHFEGENIKSELLEMIINGQKSDLFDNLRLSCQARLPDHENKAKIWSQITDINNGLSTYQRQVIMNGYWSYDSTNIKIYTDHVKSLLNVSNIDYMGQFIQEAVPKFGITQQFIDELVSLAAPYKDDEKYETFCRNVEMVTQKLQRKLNVKQYNSD